MADRLARYLITEDDFLAILRACDGKTPIQVQGLPSEPEFVAFRWTGFHEPSVWVTVRSPDHAEVADGEEIPEVSALLFVARRPTSPNPQQAIKDAQEWVKSLNDQYDAAAAYRIVRTLMRRLEESLASDEAARREVAELRLILADYRLDNEDANLAYQQGWREAMAQRDLKDGREKRGRTHAMEGVGATIRQGGRQYSALPITDEARRQFVEFLGVPPSLASLAEAVDATPGEIADFGIIPDPGDPVAQPVTYNPAGVSTGAGEGLTVPQMAANIERMLGQAGVEPYASAQPTEGVTMETTPEGEVHTEIAEEPQPLTDIRDFRIPADWITREIPVDTACLEEAGRRRTEEMERRIIEQVLGTPPPDSPTEPDHAGD